MTTPEMQMEQDQAEKVEKVEKEAKTAKEALTTLAKVKEESTALAMVLQVSNLALATTVLKVSALALILEVSA